VEAETAEEEGAENDKCFENRAPIQLGRKVQLIQGTRQTSKEPHSLQRRISGVREGRPSNPRHAAQPKIGDDAAESEPSAETTSWPGEIDITQPIDSWRRRTMTEYFSVSHREGHARCRSCRRTVLIRLHVLGVVK
jgi:hypothetical protein